MILYNVPGRTVADLRTETTLRLAEVPGIVGIKDATADIGRGSELIKALADARPPRFRDLRRRRPHRRCRSCCMGGHGVISVTANVAPKLMAQMCAAALAGDVIAARERNNRLLAAASQAVRRSESRFQPSGRWRRWATSTTNCGCRSCRCPPQFHQTVRDALREAGCLA